MCQWSINGLKEVEVAERKDLEGWPPVTKELGNAAAPPEKIGNFRKIKRIESNYVEPVTSAL